MFDMTVDYKVIELLCIIDEFCKHFDAENAGNLLEDRVKIILYQSNKVVFKVKVLSMGFGGGMGRVILHKWCAEPLIEYL